MCVQVWQYIPILYFSLILCHIFTGSKSSINYSHSHYFGQLFFFHIDLFLFQSLNVISVDLLLSLQNVFLDT